MTKDIDERFWAMVDLQDSIFPENGCMLWIGGKNTSGYGEFAPRHKNVRAHRWVYERLRGPIPEGLEIDHLCRNRACVNPDHLELVTRRVNHRRSDRTMSALAASMTHCHNGHEFNSENTHIEAGPFGPKRRCRICQRDRERKYRNAKKESTTS